MKSLPQALLWETVAHGRWSLPGLFLVANLLPLAVYGALSGLTIDSKMHEFIVLQVGFLQIVLVQLAFGIVVAQGPLSRLYTLPISTNSIVAWHTFSGAIILALEIAAASWLFNTLFNVQWPILGPALFAVAAWSALQVLMSVMSFQSLYAYFLAGTPALLMCLWLNARYGVWFSPPKYYWSEVTPSEVVILVCATGIFYMMTCYSVGFARCGEKMPTLGIGSWIEKQWEAYLLSRTAPRPFRSAAAAQFWYEWQVKGIALPLVTSMMLFVAAGWGLGALYLGTTTLASAYKALLLLGGFVSFLACAAGLFLGLEVDAKPAGQRDQQLGDSVTDMQLDSGMGCFLSSRPFSSKEFAKAILTVAARSSLIAWLMWFGLFACCHLLFSVTNQSPDYYMPPDIGILFIPVTILGPWVAMANLGTLGFSGRGARILFGLVAGFVSYFVFLLVVRQFADVVIVQQIHNVCSTAVAALVVGGSIWAFVQARKQRHISNSTYLASGLGFWALLIAAILLRPVGSQFIYYPTVVIIVSLVIVPFATMPLAIAWNRHR